jgi:hypothetical protein
VGREYREELIRKVAVLVLTFWGGIWKGTYTESYCVCCDDLGQGNIERN